MIVTTPPPRPPSLSPGVLEHAWHLNALGPFMVAIVPVVGIAIWAWVWYSLRQREPGQDAAGLNYVVGPMGSGKSMFGVKTIIEAVAKGNYAVTNVRLLDGWEYELAKKNFPRDRSHDRREARAAWLRGHYIFERGLSTAMRYRLPCAFCGGDASSCGHSGPQQEGRGVFVWDETHNDLNNRDYQGVGTTSQERNQSALYRRLILRWATQLRKLGYCGYLLSQHEENTDAQLRRVCNHIIKLQNQRHKGVGRVLPRRMTMFLVYWYPSHLADGTTRHPPTRFYRYILPWYRVLYDSWETFHGLDDDLDDDRAPIQLPKGGRSALVPGSPVGAPGTGASPQPGATPSAQPSTLAA